MVTWIATKLAGPAGLWIAGALLGAGLLTGAYAGVQTWRLGLAKAKVERVEKQRDAAIAETKREQAEHARTVEANAEWARQYAELDLAYRALQRESTRVREEGEAALAAARAKRLDAERTLAQFMTQFQAAYREPTCHEALNRLDSACPSIVSY